MSKRKANSPGIPAKLPLISGSPVPYDPSLSPTTHSPISQSPTNSIPFKQEGGILPEALVRWELIEDYGQTFNQKFQRSERKALFHVHHNLGGLPDLMEFQTAIDNAYETAIKAFLIDALPTDRFSAYIEAETLDSPIYLNPEKVENFNKLRFLDRVFKTHQSKREFLNNGILKVQVVVYRSLSGSGRGKKAPTSYADTYKNKKSVIQIKNKDNSCGYRAIAIGIKFYEFEVKNNSQQQQWKWLLRSEPAQRKASQELCGSLGLDYTIPLNIDILRQIDPLIEYQIIVINAKTCDRHFVGTDRPKTIFLLYDGQHYDLITRMTGFLDNRIYCKYCNKAYNKTIEHRCETGCNECRSPMVCNPGNPTKCKDCFVTFVSIDCFNNHKNTNLCKYEKYCSICEVTYQMDPKHPHKCDTFKCRNCSEYYEIQPHYCFIKPIDEKVLAEDSANKILVAYDIECMLIETNNIFTHVPNLLISKTQCTGEDIISGENIFYGTKCIERFVEYLLQISKTAEEKKVQITVFAHNNSGYDGHFVLRELLRRDIKGIEPIMKGTKIMKLDVGNIRFIDSLLLFQRPLADLPKMFGIRDQMKGFFPYYLNTPENQSLVCLTKDIPEEKFGVKQMSAKRYQQFKDWFETSANDVFNLKESMIVYCKSDVSILMESILRFRQLFIQTTNIDPISRSFTLASIGLEFFRAKILPANTIGITPNEGYTNYRNQSCAANAWLDIIERQYGEILIREYHIGNYFADGMILKTGYDSILDLHYDRIAFEYNGCHFHGCPCKQQNYNAEKLAKTEKKRLYYIKRGVLPVFVKECEWMKIVKRGPTFNEELSNEYHERYEYYRKVKNESLHCNPRKSLHGGRTNNLKFYGEGNIKYLDFVSLYPFVLARRDFPSGHPIVFKRNFPSLDSVFGFVSCKVLPPKRLYLPVLPMTSNEKLVFPLCRTCALIQNNYSCRCSNDERALTGTFTSVEMQKALEMGYKILETYEVLHYPRRLEDLFREYINPWYKNKAEASGWPSHCVTDGDKRQFLLEFLEKEGFTLENMESNPGLRFMAKLMLNSLWGKLAQKHNLPTTKVVKDQHELWDIFNDADLEITGEILIEDMLLISHHKKDPTKAKPGNTCVAIASFVTSYARLKLYEEMELIEASNPGSVLYFDTDSIVFHYSEGHYLPKIGPYLGEMTDEISEEYGVDAKMTEFYTLGPKTYAFKVVTPEGEKFKLKAKGITQNIGSIPVINFKSIREKAMNKANDITNTDSTVPQLQFRTNKQHEVTTRHLTKRFNVTSNKRRVDGNSTLPYGYVDENIDDFAADILDFL